MRPAVETPRIADNDNKINLMVFRVVEQAGKLPGKWILPTRAIPFVSLLFSGDDLIQGQIMVPKVFRNSVRGETTGIMHFKPPVPKWGNVFLTF